MVEAHGTMVVRCTSPNTGVVVVSVVVGGCGGCMRPQPFAPTVTLTVNPTASPTATPMGDGDPKPSTQ